MGLDWCGFWLLGGDWFVVMCWFLWRLDPGLMPGFLGCVHGCLMCFRGVVLLWCFGGFRFAGEEHGLIVIWSLLLRCGLDY